MTRTISSYSADIALRLSICDQYKWYFNDTKTVIAFIECFHGTDKTFQGLESFELKKNVAKCFDKFFDFVHFVYNFLRATAIVLNRSESV